MTAEVSIGAGSHARGRGRQKVQTYQKAGKVNLIFAYAVIIFSGAFVEQVLFGGSLVGNRAFSSNTAVNAALYLPVYIAGFFMLVRSPDTAKLLTPANSMYFVFALLAVVSAGWAISFRSSAVDGVQLALTIIAGFGFAARMSIEDMAKTLSWTCIAMLLGSVIYVFLIPSQGLMSGHEFSALQGKPQGVFAHKNRYAELASLGGFVALATRGLRPRKERLLLFALALTGLLLAESTAKLASFGLAVALWFSWVVIGKSASFRLFWFVQLILIIALGVVALPTVMEWAVNVLGKDITLTGRTLIWQHSLLVAEQRPIFGYGSGSIWQSPLGIVDTFLGYRPPHSHNTFVELYLKFGLFGLVIVFTCVCAAIGHLIGSGPFNMASKLFFLLFMAHLIRAPFEVVLFRDNQVGFLLWLCVLAMSQRQTIALRTQERPQNNV